MALPFFYLDVDTVVSNETIVLNEDTSKYIVQVLRMQNGEPIQLTNGKGVKATAIITDNHRKHCSVKITEVVSVDPPIAKKAIAISLLKNAQRFEWFLEKATELGITEIVPLLCTRTEKQSFKFERSNSILISAMLQSQQCWLPVLTEPVKFEKFVIACIYDEKLIAHCVDTQKQTVNPSSINTIMLIGPEGDFTDQEIALALQHNFLPVTLGATRLRTETAGVTAAVLLTKI